MRIRKEWRKCGLDSGGIILGLKIETWGTRCKLRSLDREGIIPYLIRRGGETWRARLRTPGGVAVGKTGTDSLQCIDGQAAEQFG
jgi:hypothetical protein